MPTPFKLIWSDISNNVLSAGFFPVAFPGIVNQPQQLQVKSNAAELQTYNTLIHVKLFITGDPGDVNIVQNIWPTLGGPTKPELNGGVDISFDFGRTYIRFDPNHGVESKPNTWIPLPVEAVGTTGADQTIGAFDVAHLIIRYIIPPVANQYKKLNIQLALDFDIL
jgi:hypothetical protein